MATQPVPNPPTWQFAFVASTGKRHTLVLCKPCAQTLHRDQPLTVGPRTGWPCDVCRREKEVKA
jgi:hypothetical protein